MESSLDDAALWATARGGDGSAFATLFRRHVRAVYNYCFRRSGSWSRAVELAPVVFRETWRRRDQVDVRDGSLLPYLLGTASAVAPPHGSSLWRRRPTAGPIPRYPADPDGRDDEAHMRAALRVIHRLPRVEQDAVALCRWQGLTEREAALAMNTPTDVVTSALARAQERTGGAAPLADQLPAAREPNGAYVDAESARLAGMVSSRHRSTLVVAVVSGALALAGTFAGVYLLHESVDDTRLVRCLSGATLNDPAIYLSRMDESGRDVIQLDDPVLACADLWAQGVIVEGRRHAQVLSPGADRRVPELTACELDATGLGPIVAVVPGSAGICSDLRLRPWSGS